jgi:two-component system sensor histidine kinase UhpB
VPNLDVLQQPERLDALRRLALANLEPEEPFDRLTRLAAAICSAPTALITFVGQDREHFKSSRGLPESLAALRETPLTYSICQYAVAARQPLVVPDTRRDPMLRTNLAVTELGIAAYAGAPLITSEGFCLGTISVLDWKPREWTDEQVALLQDLAGTAVTELELRRELSERRRIERALRESELRYRSLVEHTSDIITVVDEDGVLRYGSPSVESVLGYVPEELVGLRAAELVHPDDQPKVLEAHRMAMRDPLSAQRGVEFRVRHKDGSWRILEALGNALQYRSGGPQAVLTLRDVTDRRRGEVALRASHQQLRQLARRLDEVREVELTRVSREIHDELGHALTALRLDLGWMVPKLRRNREPVRRKAADMLAMVDDTIDAVRRIAGRLRPPVLDDLGLAAALESLVERFGRQTDIEVELQAGADDLPSLARRALYRIVQEALTNAARHSLARHAKVTLECRLELVTLEISDDGVGIPAGATDNPTSLGLVGMRERATALGADFRVGSSPGRGTTIRVTMPRQPEASL